MARVVLNDVSKVFDRQVIAVNHATLDIGDQEFMVIVGPSGCGKTTTLRMIAGLEEITEGTITIGDRIVNNVPPKDRDVAMVFQNYALYPHMTVFQNMAFALRLRKYPKAEIEQRVRENAQLLGIEKLLGRKPRALSGGQSQRVAVGRAIVRHPKAFLFDEPLSHLDANLRVATRTELKALHRRLKTTSVYVTHDQAEAMTLGDRICVMYHGDIQQVAPPLEVYDRPVNRFVAGFLGAPPMNFIDGTLEIGEGRAWFITPHDHIALPAEHAGKLHGLHGRNMVLGVRPEHFAIQPFALIKDDTIAATVEVVESLGNRMEVYLNTPAGVRLIANIDPHFHINLGDHLNLHVDLARTHVFEPGDTGRNVTLLKSTSLC